VSDRRAHGTRESVARAKQRRVAEPSNKAGTHDVHTLIIGNSITGSSAF
jgi:hypothetical protein